MGDERFLPLFRKKKTLGHMKELKGYSNILDSHVPPEILVTNYSIHQTLDKIVRKNWETLHPLEQDFIYSWFIEFKAVEEQKIDLSNEIIALNEEISRIQSNSEQQIKILSNTAYNLQGEMEKLKNELNQKKQLAEDLSNAIQNQKLTGNELKQKMEQRIQEMNSEMIKKQKGFESAQIKLAEQFQARVIELDEEKLVLSESIETNKTQLSQLEEINQDLKKTNRLLIKFKEKVREISLILSEIPPNLLKEG